MGMNEENEGMCDGTENFFSDCDLTGHFDPEHWDDMCSHGEDLGVVCVVDSDVHTAYPTGTLDIEDCVTDDFTGYTTGGLIVYV